MEDIGIPELTENQMQILSETAEKTARGYILSRIPKRKISKLDITVEIAGVKPLTISVDIDLELSPLMKKINEKKLANEAVEKALEAVEKYLRELSCRFKT